MRFERPELEDEFHSVMTGTNGGTLFGLRRTGKSTEVLACADRLRADVPPYQVVYQDAQGCGSESKLLTDILKQLPVQGWRERVTQLIADDNAIAGRRVPRCRRWPATTPTSGPTWRPSWTPSRRRLTARTGLAPSSTNSHGCAAISSRARSRRRPLAGRPVARRLTALARQECAHAPSGLGRHGRVGPTPRTGSEPSDRLDAT